MKKIMSLLLVLIMLLCVFAGCAESSHNEPYSPSESQNPPHITSGTDSDDPATPQDTEDNTPQTTPSTEPPATEPVSVPLDKLEVVSETDNCSHSKVSDSYGNAYPGPYYDFCSYGKASKDNEYITEDYTEFAVNGQYRYLTGTYFARKGQKEDADVELMIYADDELVYYSGNITRRTKAISFAVDLKDCEILRISSRSYDYSGSTNPGIILVDAVVHKEYSGTLTKGEYLNTELTPLTDLHIYSQDGTIAAGPVNDAYGNIYKGIYLDLCSWGGFNPREADIEFVANGEYKYFSGTIFTRADQLERFTIEFKIYADDELIYSSGVMNRSTKAVDFCVDITGCEMIRVMTTSSDYTSVDVNPGVIVMNPVVSNEKQ